MEPRILAQPDKPAHTLRLTVYSGTKDYSPQGALLSLMGVLSNLSIVNEPVQRLPMLRSSERPASSRGHWAMGRPPGHTGSQVGEPLLVRV